MASETAIAAIISMGLTYCRRHEVHEQKAAVAIWASTFADTDTEKLRTAVIRWAETLDEETIRAQTLPLPQTLKRIMGEGREKINDKPPPLSVTASRQHVDATQAAADQIFALVGRGPTDKALRSERAGRSAHDHQAPAYDEAGEIVTYGNEECRACNPAELAERDQAENRAKIQAVLADMPEPVADESDRRGWSGCRCDGSGMIDTKASMAALVSSEDLPRDVYPCPKCNANLFHRWQRDDLSGAKAAAE